jgi:DNA invertase Pin-like site-specific DNA recombinase
LSAAPGAKRRPEFEHALADLAAKRIDVLVIWKLDRFLRSLWDLLRVEKVLAESGGQLVSVQDGWLDTTTGPGRYMLRQYALLGEMEIDSIRVRVTRWHRQRAAAGLPLVSGRRPFGYGTKDRSAVDPIEREVIREAARRLLAGRSLRGVVRWVNELGVAAPNGKPRMPSNFRAMLLSPGIAGLRSYKGKGAPPVQGTWEAILDRGTWEALGGVLTEPGRFHRAGRRRTCSAASWRAGAASRRCTSTGASTASASTPTAPGRAPRRAASSLSRPSRSRSWSARWC